MTSSRQPSSTAELRYAIAGRTFSQSSSARAPFVGDGPDENQLDASVRDSGELRGTLGRPNRSLTDISSGRWIFGIIRSRMARIGIGPAARDGGHSVADASGDSHGSPPRREQGLQLRPAAAEQLRDDVVGNTSPTMSRRAMQARPGLRAPAYRSQLGGRPSRAGSQLQTGASVKSNGRDSSRPPPATWGTARRPTHRARPPLVEGHPGASKFLLPSRPTRPFSHITQPIDCAPTSWPVAPVHG